MSILVYGNIEACYTSGKCIANGFSTTSYCFFRSGTAKFGKNIGGALAPIVTGVIYGMTGKFEMTLYVTGAVALIGTLAHTVLLGKIEPSIGLGK